MTTDSSLATPAATGTDQRTPSRLDKARALLEEIDIHGKPDPYQPARCPSWCVGLHTATIHPEDRTHLLNTEEGAHDVPLELEEGVYHAKTRRYDDWSTSAHLGIEMLQELREVEPEIRITGYVRDRWVLRLTLDEAEALRDELDRVIRLGRKG